MADPAHDDGGLDEYGNPRKRDPLSPAWALYFPFEEFSPRHLYAVKARTLRDFFLSGTGQALLNKNKCEDLDAVTEIKFEFPSLATALQSLSLSEYVDEIRSSTASRAVLDCMGLALCSLRRTVQAQNDSLATCAEKINVRLLGYRPVTRLRRLKADRIGTFVAVRGTVLRVSGVRPLVKELDFECSKCGDRIVRSFVEGKYKPPTGCETQGCKSRTFKPLRGEASTIDYQSITLQESSADSSDDEKKASGEDTENTTVPRTVTIEFTHEIVDKLVPGDQVTISGIVKALNIDGLAGRGSMTRGRGRETGLLMVLLDANAVEKEEGERGRGGDIATHLSTRDLRTIASVGANFGFGYLVHSLCPSIYGNELVKAGLLLCLAAGGERGDESEATSERVRSEAHMLIVGDPGLGKSQMLKAASNVAPRGVYVCGNTTSATGLTAVMSKSRTGEFTLEAGALVLSDKGACCIDEFDKMKSQHSALLEAMEQQSISIAKAGVVCTLCARTCILAAANPKHGHYNRARTIGQNLNMEEALLSRFDLVFILIDGPNQARDDMLADHILGAGRSSRGDHLVPMDEFVNARIVDGSGVTSEAFSERLKRDPARRARPLHPQMLRKYLAYAKAHCHPTLSKAACRALQKFYLELRKKGGSEDSTPITTRQLESLVRLARARAKLELRSLVTEQDAFDIISLMRECVMDGITDDDFCGLNDFRAVVDHKSIKKFGMFLRQRGLSGRRKVFFFLKDELRDEYASFQRCARGKRVRNTFESVFTSMVDQRYLFKKRDGFMLCESLQGGSQY